MSLLATKKIVNQTYQEWNESFSGYPADEYTCVVSFYKDSTNKFSITLTADGTEFVLTLNPSVTGYKDKTHGRYAYQIIATKDSKSYAVETGSVVILPNLASDTDPRGYWTKIYEAAKTAYETLIAKEADSVNVLGVQVTYTGRDKLLGVVLDAEKRMMGEMGAPQGKSKIYKAKFR